MSKATSILICPRVQLNSLPDRDRDVLRAFFTQHVRGMDAKHDKRFRRFIRNLFNAAPGEGFQLYLHEERSGPFHKMHRAVLERLFNAQERYRNIDALHDRMKIKAYFVTWGEGRRGQPVMVPKSTAFPECSEAEIRELHTAMVDVLHTPAEQRHLWPHLKANQRAEMVEAVLADPKDEGA